MRQGDINTIYAARIRPANPQPYQRQRLELEDGDFIDLDWLQHEQKTRKCVLMLHGLEGDTHRTYMQYMAELYHQNGWDVCCMNFRSCSEEINRVLSCYHSGKTDDVLEVLQRKICGVYEHIVLHGYSLGGNLVLKFAAEHPHIQQIKAVVSISSPIDLESSSDSIMRRRNRVYERTFHKKLVKKLMDKKAQFPEELKEIDVKSIRNLREFDDAFTAPIHGFENASDYYAQSNSLPVLPQIKIPIYLLNALDDSFLSTSCYPYALAEKMENLFLETPKNGGHVGFFLPQKYYYHEVQSLQFVQKHVTEII